MGAEFETVKGNHSLEETASKPSWWKWGIAFAACLGAIMEVIDTSIVNVALPHMQATMGVTVSEIGWTITGYAMANVIMIPLSAWLGERFGKKNYFIFCLIGFTIASVLCGMANSLPMLVTSRILQGIAGGGLLAKAQGVLFETFHGTERGLAQALFGIGVMVGPAMGPVLGGYLTDNLGWRSIFFINIPFGIMAIVATMIFFLQDKKKGDQMNRPVDWFGILFLTIGLGSLQVFLEEGNRDDWFQSPFITVMACLAVIGLTLFIWQELTVDNPAVNLRVLRHRSLAAGSMFSVVLGVGLYGSIFAIPVFAQSLLNFTATKTGLLLLPSAVASAFFMLISSKLAQKFDNRWIVFTGAMILSFSMFQLMHINPNTGEDYFFWPNVFRGIGTVLMFLPLTLASMSTVPQEEIHAATGFYNLTRQIGGSMGIAALTTTLEQRENFHRSVLAEHISTYDPMIRQHMHAMTDMFASSGPHMAQMQSAALMDRMLNMQALILSYSDLFWSVGILFIVSTILIFFLGSGKMSPAAAMEAH
jgi:DHA2 family multidrug resistance protein